MLLQLSKALRVSAETLYVRAGILDPEEHTSTSVEMAVLADGAITERQKRVLIDVYASFVKENERSAETATTIKSPNTLNHEEQIEMPSKSTPAQDKKSARESDYAPLYVVAGLTDALADALRSALAESQERARKRIDRAAEPGTGRAAAGEDNTEELRTFVITLPEQVKHLPEATKARIAELQTQANELLAQANTAYSELAGRGKHAVDEARGNARSLSEQAEKLAHDARSEAGVPRRPADGEGAGGHDQGPPGRERPDRDRDRDPAERGEGQCHPQGLCGQEDGGCECGQGDGCQEGRGQEGAGQEGHHDRFCRRKQRDHQQLSAGRL